MRTISRRAAERAAKRAILDVANADDCPDASRLASLARLSGVINGCILDIESRQPAPTKTDPRKRPEIYI